MDILINTASNVLIDYSLDIVETTLYYQVTHGSEIINYPKSLVTLIDGIDITGKEVQKWKYTISNGWELNTSYIDPNILIRADRLTNSRIIELSGNVIGEEEFDGSGDIIINTQVGITVSNTQPVTDTNTPNGLLWIKI